MGLASLPSVPIMATGILYDPPVSFNLRSTPAKAAAALAGVKVVLVPDFKLGEDNNTDEFRAKFPLGKVPALEMSDGFTIFESYPVSRYISSLSPESGLLGQTPEETALVDQWAHLSESEISSAHDLIRCMFFTRKLPYSEPLYTWLVEKQTRAFEAINAHLQGRTFLVGENLTVADLVVAKDMHNACKTVFDASLRAKCPNLVRHLENVVSQPKLKGVYPETMYIEKALAYDLNDWWRGLSMRSFA
ncbi:glutathione S-transferase C-terminal-like protein [Flagelloscypha sp. PMI_526]|nr:glutathione S-transferase C-terminal-like protein [Flagelloscypha sp. PMI_526]